MTLYSDLAQRYSHFALIYNVKAASFTFCPALVGIVLLLLLLPERLEALGTSVRSASIAPRVNPGGARDSGDTVKRVLLAAALALTAATAGTSAASAYAPEPEGSPAPEMTNMPEENAPDEGVPEETTPGETGEPGETGAPGAPGGPEATPTGEMTPGMTASPMGPGCASLKDTISGVADQPAGTALTKIPDLSKLSQAVKQVGLEEKLNSAKDITIFAPNDAAFGSAPTDVQDAMSDKAAATKILSYHVVEGKVNPADLKDGDMLKTHQGGELSVKGTGENMTINDAKIVCGGIPTSNATLYIIDKVLMPK